MVNGIDSLISLSDFSLLVCRNESDFWVLILYHATSLNSLVSSRFSDTIFRVFYLQYYVICKQWELYFFSDLDSFDFFSSLIAAVRTSRTMLNNSGESGHTCIVPDLRGNAFTFSPQANLENSAVATGLEKVSFHSNPKERQCQRTLKLPHNCTHLTH